MDDVTRRPARALRGAHDTWLITGEAVLIEIPPASLPARVVSGVIDVVVYVLCLLGCTWFLASQSGLLNAASGGALTTLALVGCLVVLPVVVETTTRGRSLGKLALGLRTVRDDGGPIVFRHALARALVGFVEIFALVGIPAFVAAAVTPRGKRLGDLAAGTYVVRMQRLRPPATPPGMPPGLSAWAAGCDIGPLPDGLALAVRGYLGRLPALTPAARATVGASLLAQVAPYVTPAPPHGTPTEAVLAAVLAERRGRAAARLARDEQLRSLALPADPLRDNPA